MNIRPLIAALAFVSIAAPLAAHADAPSGDINTVFAIDQTRQASVPDFDRREHRTYVEDILAGPTSTTSSQVTREQVREELAQHAAGARRGLSASFCKCGHGRAASGGAPTQGAPRLLCRFFGKTAANTTGNAAGYATGTQRHRGAGRPQLAGRPAARRTTPLTSDTAHPLRRGGSASGFSSILVDIVTGRFGVMRARMLCWKAL